MGNGDLGKKRRVISIGNGDPSPSAAGTGVDIYGGPVVDPTKNVLDLVKAESKYQDAMRDATEKLANAKMDAEQRRIDDLAALRLTYDQRIAEDLRVNVKTTSDQLAGQLVKETGSLSAQITALTTSFTAQLTTLTSAVDRQVSALTSAITPRIADLERFRWEQGGKTSERDPAVTQALNDMSKAINKLQETGNVTTGHSKGLSDIWGFIVGAAVAGAAIAGVVAAFIHH
jgi:hypothetical protein